MLQQVLQAIEAANGPVHIKELARQLNIEPGALEGMIQFWVRKGRLQEVGSDHIICSGEAPCHLGSCTEPSDCPFELARPRAFSLTPENKTGS